MSGDWLIRDFELSEIDGRMKVVVTQTGARAIDVATISHAKLSGAECITAVLPVEVGIL